MGIASAMKNAGVGVGVPDIGRCHLFVKDGRVHIRTSAAPMGQGLQTVLVQIVCDTVNINLRQAVIENPDTKYTPDSGTTTASGKPYLPLKPQNGRRKRSGLNWIKVRPLWIWRRETLKENIILSPIPSVPPKENPVSHVAYGYATQVVVIDESGKAVITKQAVDVGRAMNPTALEGQFEGGTAMSMGYGLTEDFPLSKGIPTAKYGTLGLLRSTDMPEIICAVVEKNSTELTFGAKGAGEITAVTFTPAVQNAYYKKDGVFRTRLPLENTYYNKK